MTNTPLPEPLLLTTPAAPMNRYALRTWNAGDLQAVLARYLRQLQPGGKEMQKLVRLMQYELERRFPGAPRTMAARLALLSTMLAAPRGSVDLRDIARPYIENLLNQHGGPADFSAQGFQIEATAANFDGRAPQDALLHVRYRDSGGDLRYEDYLPVVTGETGQWQVLSTPILPAAPSPDVEAITLEGVEDYNRDGVVEIALSLDRGDLNRELRIFGWRGGGLASLTPPGSPLLYQTLRSWEPGGPIEVTQVREEDAAWRCLGELQVNWDWRSNLFRPTPDPAGWFFASSAGCLLYGAEPIFAQPFDKSLSTLNKIVAAAPDASDFAVQRARVMQAMLHLFDGDVGGGLAIALDLQSKAETGSWLAQQAAVLVSGLSQTDIKPLEICAALVAIQTDGGCNVDDALGRMLSENPLRRDEAIAPQLADLGIHVQGQATVSQVGMLDREVVRFELAGEHWWSFAPLDQDYYRAERTQPLPELSRATAPLPLIVAPQSMYDALLVDDNPAAVLTALDNLVREHPRAAIFRRKCAIYRR